jgi:hypothetical protein
MHGAFHHSWNRSCHMYDEFEDTKGVIRISKSKKNRPHNGQMIKYKRTNVNIRSIKESNL